MKKKPSREMSWRRRIQETHLEALQMRGEKGKNIVTISPKAPVRKELFLLGCPDQKVPNLLPEKVRTSKGPYQLRRKSPDFFQKVRTLKLGSQIARGRSELSPQGLDSEAKTSIFRFFRKFPIRAKTLWKLSRTFRKLTKTSEGYRSTLHTLQLRSLLKVSVLQGRSEDS